MNKFKFNKNIDHITDEKAKEISVLPLTHNTDIENYQDIINSEVLIPKKCDVFDEDIMYFFYGLPIYAKKDWTYPVFFFLKTLDENLDIKGVYPIDTGGLYHGIIKDRNKGETNLDSSKIKEYFNCEKEEEEHHITSRKIIRSFFENNKNYLEGNMVIEQEKFKTFYGKEFSAFTNMESLYFDKKRVKAIEIHNSKELKLDSSNLELLILPEELYNIFKEETEKIFDSTKIITYNKVIRDSGLPIIIDFARKKVVDFLNKKESNAE